jgi:hypothetical protein
MSSDGKYQTTVVNGGRIYTSVNYGVTWAQADGIFSYYWSVAMSSDGKYQTAVVNNGRIYTSTANSFIAGGNFGIGTTNPGTYKLNVAGDIIAQNYYSADGSVGIGSTANGLTFKNGLLTSGTLNIASGSQDGLLSSANWTTFNNKQDTLTNPVTGTGTTNFLPKFNGTSTLTNSLLYDNGTSIGIGTTNPGYQLNVNGNAYIDSYLQLGNPIVSYNSSDRLVIGSVTNNTGINFNLPHDITTGNLITLGSPGGGILMLGAGHNFSGNYIVATQELNIGTSATVSESGHYLNFDRRRGSTSSGILNIPGDLVKLSNTYT